MCVHCEKKQLSAVNQLLDVLHEGEKTKQKIADISTAKSWDSKPPETPYQDFKKLMKRVDINTKLIAKVFKIWEERFNERYKQARGNDLFLLRKEDLSVQAWEEILAVGLIQADELYDVLISIAGDEVKVSANEIIKSLFKLKAEVVEGVNEPPRYVMEFLEQYEFRLSQSTAMQVDDRLKNIVVNGLTNGQSSPAIAKEIRNTFVNLGKKKSLVIARTETIRASGEGAKLAYTKAGIDKIAILPALTACPICMDAASNNPYKTEKPKINIPIHPNCRCTWVPVFDESDVEAISSGVVNQDSF